MEFSLFYFASVNYKERDVYRLLIDGATYGDRNGFAAVWMPERHFHQFGGPYPNPSVTASALAARTSRIGLRAGSVVIPLHDPIRVAEEWSVVDNLSGGRVAISFASGWQPQDFALAPATYADRRVIMVERIDQVRRLWRGESLSRLDGSGDEVEIEIWPKPVQDELPVWVTSSGNVETFELAGRLGAGVLTHLLRQPLPDLAKKIAAYRGAWQPVGVPTRPHVTLMVHTLVGADVDEVRELVRGPFSGYLASSIGLWANRAELAELSREDVDAVVAHAFDRYFLTAGLFGTPITLADRIRSLAAIGVDELACLVDFGVEAGAVLAGLERLADLRDRTAADSAAARRDPVYLG